MDKTGKKKKNDSCACGPEQEKHRSGEDYLRVLADYRNLENRMKNERVSLYKFAAEEIIIKVLPALDSLETASGHLKDKGLDLAVRQLTGALAESGVVKIETAGREFDPAEMEAVDVVDADGENQDNIVAGELRPGYKLNGKVIRPAQVKVSKIKLQVSQAKRE